MSKSGKSAMRSHALSVYPETPAAEFMEWLQKVWANLTPAQRKSAYMEIRPHKDMVMLGFRWSATDIKLGE